jgi:hypothetical protein
MTFFSGYRILKLKAQNIKKIFYKCDLDPCMHLESHKPHPYAFFI